MADYLGIVDMTCGYHGMNPTGYFNFHYIAVDWPKFALLKGGMKSFITSKFANRKKFLKRIANFVGPQNGALGGAVGHFMKTIYDSLSFPESEFEQSANIVELTICKETKKIATPYCPIPIEEKFIMKYAPTEKCEIHTGRQQLRGNRRRTF